MADVFTPAKRSQVMSRIRSRDTKPEQRVRAALHRLGYRFRKDSGRRLPGRPDVVLPKHGIAVFVHGCFWHRHPQCKFAYTPKSRCEFWQAKFAKNVERDRKAIRKLRALGWSVLTVWECETRSPQYLHALLRRLLDDLPGASTGRRLASSSSSVRAPKSTTSVASRPLMKIGKAAR